MLNIVFMGTPDFAKDSLEALVKKGHNILGVVTTPDRPKGRGMQMQMTPVKEYAVEQNFTIYQPEQVKENGQFIETMKVLEPDLFCVVSYGKILPKELLEIPKLGAINVHPSLLPKYRGSAPIQWSIINGDKETGVTIMYIDEKMDSGDMILKKEVQIKEEETTGELWDRLSKIGAELLVEAIDKIEEGTAPRIKQGDNYTIAPMINKEISSIDWENKSTEQIKNLVRGLNPFMGTYTYLQEKKVKIWKVKEVLEEEFKLENEIDRKISPGTVVFVDSKKGMYIKTIDGVLSILEIQAENAKKMEICEFLRGNKVSLGEVMKNC